MCPYARRGPARTPPIAARRGGTMSRLRFTISTSLDGYVAGPDQTREEPLGRGGEGLHEWVVRLRAWREAHGVGGGGVARRTGRGGAAPGAGRAAVGGTAPSAWTGWGSGGAAPRGRARGGPAASPRGGRGGRGPLTRPLPPLV